MLVCILIPAAENFLLFSSQTTPPDSCSSPYQPYRALKIVFKKKKKCACAERGKIEGDHRTLKHSSSEAVGHICTVFTKMYAEGKFPFAVLWINCWVHICIYIYVYIYISHPPCVFQQSKVIKIWHLPREEFGLIEVAAGPEVHKPPVKAAASSVFLAEEKGNIS